MNSVSEQLKKTGRSIFSPGATPLETNRRSSEKMHRNDAKWHLPDEFTEDNQATVVALKKLLKVQEQANVALVQQREELEKRIRIQRRLIVYLRDEVKLLGARLNEKQHYLERREYLSHALHRENRVKSLTNALMRIRGVDTSGAETEPAAEEIAQDEFLPITDPVERKAFLKKEVLELQSDVRDWVSRVVRLPGK